MDITERKRAEQERREARQLRRSFALMNRVSLMGELVASLAHEIKQPVTSGGEQCPWLACDCWILTARRRDAVVDCRGGRDRGPVACEVTRRARDPLDPRITVQLTVLNYNK